MRKINIGAGTRWYKEGWEILDNGSGSYKEKWKHFGKAWDTKLPSSAYDIIYTSHTLEHIPHFKNEETVAEFNRILKVGGWLRISVPDLEKAAIAYVNSNIDYFNVEEILPTYHLGLGSAFLNLIISPGHQTLVINKHFDEAIGSYAHLYSYDFEMLKILLDKWGFGDIVKSDYEKSSVGELREVSAIVYNSNKYPIDDAFAKEKLKSDHNTYRTGFDNVPEVSLFVEARKIKDVSYDESKLFCYTTRNRFENNKLFQLKLSVIRHICNTIDILYGIYKKIKPH